ncbi:uncharacterized protein LOC121999410 [Zingiber officinale]|uniref:uncharacterized protein LOC121999410 n=1 Tax=Zingiber officinale TaxID=94328 RepID=UPI001C4D8011|nr:uncharacterized protein LOC121999410 [Zingiber officinale]
MEEEAGSSFKLFGTVIQMVDGQGKEEVEVPGRMAVEEERTAAVASLPCPRACHRYWTAGGTLRNVLVCAGRRRGCPGPRGRAAGGRGVLDHTSPAGCLDRAAEERWA